MKYLIFIFAAGLIASCTSSPEKQADAATGKKTDSLSMEGTWRLVSGYIITKGDSAFTDYTKNQRMIKMINKTHFGFFKHDVDVKKDSGNHFDAGGGKYELKGDRYTEHLDYYNNHAFEGAPYTFTVKVSNDTLTQFGNETADRAIIEKYVREN